MPRAAKRVSLRSHAKSAGSAPKSTGRAIERDDAASEAGWEDASDVEDEDEVDDAPMLDAAVTSKPSKKSEKRHHRSIVESKLPTQKHTTSHQQRQPNLSSSIHPYSKSHARRLRRSTLKGGTTLTTEFADALAEAEGSISPTPHVTFSTPINSTLFSDPTDPNAEVPDHLSRAERKKQNRANRLAATSFGSNGFERIGEGKGRTLKARQRNAEITANKTRIPAIIANPAFKLNPFEAIRVHATNTLEMRGARVE